MRFMTSFRRDSGREAAGEALAAKGAA